MAKGKNYSIYLSAETDEKFEMVKQHIGYGTSETIANLILCKANEIKDGMTRRDQIAAMREDMEKLKCLLLMICAKLDIDMEVNGDSTD
jgi:NTP pyrophosphatase (non-canonical NTP hydrolase)